MTIQDSDHRTSINVTPAGWLWLAAGAYAAMGLVVMAWLSPKVPYADAWRHLARLLATPFPANVLAADNGHREVLPNLVRLLELDLFAANQWLQILAGMLLSLATAGLLLRGFKRSQVDPAIRASAACFAILGLYWLGNERVLAHGSESVHVYLVVLCLASGTLLLADAPAQGLGIGRACLAGAMGFVAAFSFGSGMACFVAFLVVLALRRAPWAQWLAVLACFAITTLLYVLPAGSADTQIALMPVRQTDLLLRWLAGPSMYAVWPLVEPSVAAQVPLAELRSLATASASVFVRIFGAPLTSRWPALLIGVLGVAWLAAASVSAWRDGPTVPAMARVGLGIAWFALTVGGLIVLARLDYFSQHPGQLLAPRYIPWSSLFWAGLAFSSALRMPARAARRVAIVTGLVAVSLLPSQLWMGKLAERTASVADGTALAAAAGVIDADLELGENVPAELVDAIPLLRDKHAAMFGWRETDLLDQGRRAPDLVTVPVHELHVSAVENLIGEDGLKLDFRLDGASARRALLVDASGVVVGIAAPDASAGQGQWIGWARGTDANAPHVVALPGPTKASQ